VLSNGPSLIFSVAILVLRPDSDIVIVGVVAKKSAQEWMTPDEITSWLYTFVQNGPLCLLWLLCAHDDIALLIVVKKTWDMRHCSRIFEDVVVGIYNGLDNLHRTLANTPSRATVSKESAYRHNEETYVSRRNHQSPIVVENLCFRISFSFIISGYAP
jgi:hypothetical protein